MPFLNREQLEAVGFKRVGREVKVSIKASIYNPAAIEIGDFSRIDDYCVLSAGAGGVFIGRNVHIAVFSSLIGAERIELHDFSNISSRVSIYSSNDDYSGKALTNPTVPEAYTGVFKSPVVIERHVIVGSGTVILPGVRMSEGSAAGALSLIKNNCDPFGLYAGVPAKLIGKRSDELLLIEKKFLNSRNCN